MGVIGVRSVVSLPMFVFLATCQRCRFRHVKHKGAASRAPGRAVRVLLQAGGHLRHQQGDLVC